MTILTKHQTRVYGPAPIAGWGHGATLTATVRYDDLCGNGHNSFGITGEIQLPRGRDNFRHRLRQDGALDCATTCAYTRRLKDFGDPRPGMDLATPPSMETNMAKNETVEIREGSLHTTLSHEGQGWNWACSVDSVLWAKGWVRGTRQSAYHVAVRATLGAMRAEKVFGA